MKKIINPITAHDIVRKTNFYSAYDLTYDLTKSYGNYIWDSKNNRPILDCMGFFASNPLGHNHPKMLEREFSEKLLRVSRTNPANTEIITEEYAGFIQSFYDIAFPSHFKYLFLISGGSAAVENALKTAFDWKLQFNRLNDIHIHPNELDVIHLRKAFHGRGGYTLSLTNTSDPRKYRDFPKWNWTRFDPPSINFDDMSGIEELTNKTIVEMEDYLEKHHHKVAAIIIEPIQGEGGDNYFTDTFHTYLRFLANEFNCLLIYDEIQTGLGITGKWWAYQNYSIVPDIIVFGKKAQVCGIIVGRVIDSVERHVFNEKSRLDSTWNGNLTDMVRGQRYLEVVKEDKLLSNTISTGAYLLEGLKDVSKNLEEKFYNVRGLGLMIAFDFPIKELRDSFLEIALKHGLLCLGCGSSSIRLRPSLTFNKKDVDCLLDKVGTIAKKIDYI